MAKYHENGVQIHPATPSKQGISKVTYNGLLFQNGATEVYAHVGYHSNWENPRDYKMHKTIHGFEAAIPIPREAETLNICFRDTADNWDNNSGSNYSYPVGGTKETANWEVSNELGLWGNMLSRCRSNVSACKTAISRWLES